MEKQLLTNGVLCITNKGVSMLPLLREDRDVMVIRRVDSKVCKKLDAVLFKRPFMHGRGHYVLHRILRINPDGSFWIVGDNCTLGETVQPENVLGILTDIVRDGKKISVNDWRYKLYVYLWCAPYPLRFFVLKTKAFLRKGWHCIKK